MDLEAESDTKLYTIQEIKNLKEEYIEVARIHLLREVNVLSYYIHTIFF